MAVGIVFILHKLKAVCNQTVIAVLGNNMRGFLQADRPV
jgi:hypothetical protein